MQRTAIRLAENLATAFGEAAPVLSMAELTMVNRETAITTRGEPAPKILPSMQLQVETHRLFRPLGGVSATRRSLWHM